MIELKILDARLPGDRFPRYATNEAAAIDLRACNIQGQDFDHVVIAPSGSDSPLKALPEQRFCERCNDTR